MNTRGISLLCIILTTVILIAGCSSPDSEIIKPPENTFSPTPTSEIETTDTMSSTNIQCGRNVCQATEGCCNGFCIDLAVHTCCGDKPCQGSCCNVSGIERCYDPKIQTCCEEILCDVGACCAGTCSPPGQYYCVYVNGTGCYGLPDFLKCSWKDGGYKLVRLNVPYGDIEPSYMDIIIVPATNERSQISEYWVIPALGGGGGEPAHRVKEG